MVMEAMKMEDTIKASRDGICSVAHYNVDDAVQGGVVLLVVGSGDENDVVGASRSSSAILL
jgi:acetyl/propionyl-CoA carboxylase alpha subunit